MQTSAAAFTKGLLDLEGAALTPILVRCASYTFIYLHHIPKLAAEGAKQVGPFFDKALFTTGLQQLFKVIINQALLTLPVAAPRCSLVKKDAGMLDAFGKGASADIQLAKQELYAQVGGCGSK